VIEEEVATVLADLLLSRYPSLVSARYGLSVAGMDGASLLEAIARRRGFAWAGEAGLTSKRHPWCCSLTIAAVLSAALAWKRLNRGGSCWPKRRPDG